MALRSFTAPDGAVWQVWQVEPAVASIPERRVMDRRSPDPVLLYKGEERRKAERRKGGRRPGLLQGEFEKGWLVFECENAKKRLAPPPEGWDSCPECDLVEHWRRARDVSAGAPIVAL